ncbi:hypothetical protein C3B59_10300 [Cryobacterium zongtaii]|uniref:Uncharacterized protein n=1 Tax=Cryobacterium zongtaii TaxID=1259217 RepID=A0A2S3ZCY6_9MICO|nr:hypothetical protein C3B59_10300 [Cryobacterium zongtaii]
MLLVSYGLVLVLLGPRAGDHSIIGEWEPDVVHPVPERTGVSGVAPALPPERGTPIRTGWPNSAKLLRLPFNGRG